MSTKEWFHIQRLDGYTDGKESWLKLAKTRSRDYAEIAMAELAKRHPNWKMRIRKIVRR